MVFRKVVEEKSFIDNLMGTGIGLLSGFESMGQAIFSEDTPDMKFEEQLYDSLQDLTDEELSSLGIDKVEVPSSKMQSTFGDQLNEATNFKYEDTFGYGAGKTTGEIAAATMAFPPQLLGVLGGLISPRAGEFLGAGSDSVMEGLSSAARFGVGSEVGKELGFGEVGQIATGIGADILPSAARGLGKASANLAEDVGKIFSDARKSFQADRENLVAETLKSQEYQAQKDLMKSDIAKTKSEAEALSLDRKKLQRELQDTSEMAIQDYENKFVTNAEPSYINIEGKSVEEIEKELVSDVKNEKLRKIAPVETTQDSMNRVKNAINDELVLARNEYRNLYQDVDEAIENVLFQDSEQLVSILNDIRNEVPQMYSNPQDKQNIIKKINDAIKDLKKPKIIEKNKKQFNELIKLLKDPIIGKEPKLKMAESLKRINKPTIKQVLDIKRNLSDFVNYETLVPNSKNILKKPIEDFDNVLTKYIEAIDSEAAQKLKQANQKYRETARIYNDDHVLSIRKTNAAEKTMPQNLIGSNAQAVKKALNNSPVEKYFEAELLRNLSTRSSENGKSLLREISPHLSEEARKLGNEIVSYGDKLKVAGVQNEAYQTILKDAQKMAVTGERPSSTLKMLDTTKGQALVENFLDKSPKGREILQNLYKQKGTDYLTSIFESGRLNEQMLKNILKDPVAKRNFVKAFGQDAINFAQRLNNDLGKIKGNIDRLTKMQEDIDRLVFEKQQNLRNMGEFGQINEGIQSGLNGYSDPIKDTANLAILGLGYMAGIKGVLGGLALKGLRDNPEILTFIRRLFTNPKLRTAFKDFTNPKNYLTTKSLANTLADFATVYNTD